MHSPVRRVMLAATAALGWLLLAGGAVLAQDAVAEEALFVTVQNPITSDVVNRIKNQVNPRRNSEVRPLRTVVFDFNPDDKDASTVDFGACSDLAKFAAELKEMKTIAFVHAKVTGHTVLPALACKELVMAKAASIGEVAADGVPPLRESERVAYREMFNRDPQFAIVQKMFDRDVQLWKARTRQQEQIVYYDKRKEAELKGLLGPEEVKFVQAGQLGLYTADQARNLGLGQSVAETRQELAETYNLSASSIRDDVLQGRTPEAYRFTLKGEVDTAMRESINRLIADIKRKKGNTLILTLNCAGGDLGVARQLADDLVKAQAGEDGVLVIGYVPDNAPDAAVFLAFGCTDIVMSKRKDAKEADPDAGEAEFGNFENVIKAGKPGAVDAHRKSLRELAEQRGYPGIVVDGFFDKDLEIVRVRGTVNRAERRLMNKAEFDAQDPNQKKWEIDGSPLKPRNQFLRLNATKAYEVGVARYVVDHRDPKEVYALYGIDPARVKEATPGLLDRFAEFLRMPVVTVLLVVIGFTGLILELKVPGLTVPGIVAALCFILVFWANSRFSGETFVLAMLLFIMGLILLGLEIFVFPGFGAPGIVGILCMLAGLGLVTIDRIPQTGSEWGELGSKVSQYMFGMVGAVGLAFLIARFLPKVPYANRMLLAPPAENTHGVANDLPGGSEAAGLLGAIGTTNTTLRPAGVVRFADKFVDVVSDGGFIPAGTRVQVIAVEGTRIVVKEV